MTFPRGCIRVVKNLCDLNATEQDCFTLFYFCLRQFFLEKGEWNWLIVTTSPKLTPWAETPCQLERNSIKPQKGCSASVFRGVPPDVKLNWFRAHTVYSGGSGQQCAQHSSCYSFRKHFLVNVCPFLVNKERREAWRVTFDNTVCIDALVWQITFCFASFFSLSKPNTIFHLTVNYGELIRVGMIVVVLAFLPIGTILVLA